MMRLIAEAMGWGEAIAAARRDGFEVLWLDDAGFVIRLGERCRRVAFGENVMQRAVDVCLQLLAEEDAAA